MKNQEGLPRPDAIRETVQMPTSGGLVLEGTLFKSSEIAEKSPATLFIHGWMSRRKRGDTTAEKLVTTLHETALTFDLRAHSKRKDTPDAHSRQEYLDDVIAAYDFLAAQPGVDPEQMRVVGASFGAYLATLLSKERKVKSLALRVPADYPDEGFDEPELLPQGQEAVTDWRKEIRDSDSTLALKALHEFTGKVLLVESGKDTQVPHQTVANYAKAVSDKKQLTHVFVRDAEHSVAHMPEMQEEFDQIVLDFAKANKEK